MFSQLTKRLDGRFTKKPKDTLEEEERLWIQMGMAETGEMSVDRRQESSKGWTQGVPHPDVVEM